MYDLVKALMEVEVAVPFPIRKRHERDITGASRRRPPTSSIAPIARAPSSPRICEQQSAKRNGDVDQQPKRRPGGSRRSVRVRAGWNRRAPRAGVRAAIVVNAAPPLA
jgi:hypothetical protein